MGRRDRRRPPRPGAPAPPGRQLELEVDSLAQGGRGVARANGYVVFVTGGAARRPRPRPDRQGQARLRRGDGDRAARARAPTGSPTRCVHDGEPCPGAPWQGMPYERQLAEKHDQVDDALRRLGELDGFELEPIEPAVEQWRYRNKLEYSFGERGRRARARLSPPRQLGRRSSTSTTASSPRRPTTRPATRSATGRATRASPPTTAARPDGRAAQPRRPRGPAHRPAPDPPRHLGGRDPTPAGRPAHGDRGLRRRDRRADRRARRRAPRGGALRAALPRLARRPSCRPTPRWPSASTRSPATSPG